MGRAWGGLVLLLLTACSSGTGTAGGSGGGGGAGAGGGSGGGGAGPKAGALNVPSFVFGPKVVASSDGVFHTAHRTQTPEAIVYGRCASDCGSAQQWSSVTLEANSGFVGKPRIAVDASQRVHVVYNLSSTSRNVYATCASGCTAAANWTKTELPAAADCDWHGEDSNLVVDTQGRLSFVSTDFNTQKLCVSTCASACTTPASWQTGLVASASASGRRIDFGFAGSGTTLHLVYDDLTNGLRYQSCASNCAQAASWQVSAPLFFHGDAPAALAAAPNGRLALVFNQGTTDPGAPADVKMLDGRLQLWECSADCGVRASWNGLMVGDPDDGKNGVAVVTSGPGTLAISTRATTRAFACEGNCTAGASWSSADLDTQMSLLAALPDPAAVLGCTVNGQPAQPVSATWSPEHPSVAVSSAGTVVFAGTGGLRTCPGVGTAAAFPGYGRVLFSPP